MSLSWQRLPCDRTFTRSPANFLLHDKTCFVAGQAGRTRKPSFIVAVVPSRPCTFFRSSWNSLTRLQDDLHYAHEVDSSAFISLKAATAKHHLTLLEFVVHFPRIFCSFFTNFLFIFHYFCVHFSRIFCSFSKPDNPSRVARKHAFVPPTPCDAVQRGPRYLLAAGKGSTRSHKRALTPPGPRQNKILALTISPGCYMVQSCLIETLGKTDVDG